MQLVRTLYINDFTPTRRSMSFHDVIAEGVFWPVPSDCGALGTRTLFGEIPLRKKLTPSFAFSKLSIQVRGTFYTVRPYSYTPDDNSILSYSTPYGLQILRLPLQTSH